MVLMTMIARVSDGLPLAASVQDDEQVRCGMKIVEHFNTKLLMIWLISDWKKCPWISKSGQNVVQEIECSIASTNDYWNWTLFIPVRKQLVYVSIYNDLYLFFSYLIEHQVCYLILCEKSFSKRLAFSFLEDLQNEFINQYGHKINSITRPYSFIEFGILKFIINSFFLYWFFTNR